MGANLSTWDDIRRIADELELKIHLGGMDARDRWQALQPRLAHLESSIAHSGGKVGEAINHELIEVEDALRHLREDIYTRARGDFQAGW